MAKDEHDLDGIVSAAKKDPRFGKMKRKTTDEYDEEEGTEEGETCEKCGHRSGHE